MARVSERQKAFDTDTLANNVMRGLFGPDWFVFVHKYVLNPE